VSVTEAVPHLQAGRVGRAHGLDGSFYVTGARPRLLAMGTPVTIDGRTRPIVRLAGIDKRPIVRLEGVEDRSAAEALRGLVLSVDELNVPTLSQDEWWAHELEGCVVYDGERQVGMVSHMLELPSCEALEVSREDGRELLVPLVRDAVRGVDVPNRRIDVNMEFVGESWT
jgi:16S rRNA processing protein RimM